MDGWRITAAHCYMLGQQLAIKSSQNAALNKADRPSEVLEEAHV